MNGKCIFWKKWSTTHHACDKDQACFAARRAYFSDCGTTIAKVCRELRDQAQALLRSFRLFQGGFVVTNVVRACFTDCI